MRFRTTRALGIAVSAAALLGTACSDSDPDFREPTWQWTALSGPPAATPESVGNHEPLLRVGDTLFLGTTDGVWRRPFTGNGEWERSGLDGRVVHTLAVSATGDRIVAIGFDPQDDAAPSAWYSLSGGADWVPPAFWPRGQFGTPHAGKSFQFATLEPDPHDASVFYAGVSADTIAVTVDGGANWILANGALEPNFGYACVPFRPRGAMVLLLGCELPLDIAWVGARTVHENRFELSDFRYLYGYPSLDELGNRRVNAIAAPQGRSDRILVGVEGGLVELTSTDGAWSDRDAIDVRWVYHSESDSAEAPYVYMRAIAPLSADGRHALFGGTVNGTNTELWLFETVNGGQAVRLLPPPAVLDDPRVEQAVRLASNDVLLVISAIEGTERVSKVYRLQRP